MEKESRGFGFVGLLTLIFITLKLVKVIAWNWWWVLSPVWITILLAFIITVFSVIMSRR